MKKNHLILKDTSLYIVTIALSFSQPDRRTWSVVPDSGTVPAHSTDSPQPVVGIPYHYPVRRGIRHRQQGVRGQEESHRHISGGFVTAHPGCKPQVI